jgi:hypothetical protein
MNTDLEKKIAQELSGDAARKHIEKVTREIPFRMAGTEELKRMAEYLRDPMAGYGIPCLYETRNLANLSPSSTEYQALLTHLVQQANRVSDGLREASELIETAMEEWKRI